MTVKFGLSLSYGIVSKVGGTIDCHSAPGEGTEFIVRFPCVMDTPASGSLAELTSS